MDYLDKGAWDALCQDYDALRVKHMAAWELLIAWRDHSPDDIPKLYKDTKDFLEDNNG